MKNLPYSLARSKYAFIALLNFFLGASSYVPKILSASTLLINGAFTVD